MISSLNCDTISHLYFNSFFWSYLVTSWLLDMSDISNLDELVSNSRILFQEETIEFFRSLETFIKIVANNSNDWYKFVLALKEDCVRLQQRVSQLKKDEIVFESQLDDAFNRARLIEKKMNQIIEVKLHLQKELINAHALLATKSHLEFKSSSFFFKKSIKQANSKKFTSKNREKLKAWLIKIHNKMRINVDHFVESKWSKKKIKQTKMLYVISRLNSDALNQIKLNITKKYIVIDFDDWQTIVVVIKRVYNEIDSKRSVRRKLIKLYQINKNFETFWSEFHRYDKQAKMFDDRILNYLKDRLFNEINDRLINILDMSTKLHVFVKKVRQLNINMQKLKKKNTRRLYREDVQDTQSASNNSSRFNEETRIETSTTKSANSFVYSLKSSMFRAFTTSNSSSTSIVSSTHVDSMNLSSSSKRDSFTQVEKKYRRVNNFCNYCEELEHIAIDHQDSTTLNAKKRVYNLRLVFVQLTSHYNNIIDETMTKVTKNEKFSS